MTKKEGYTVKDRHGRSHLEVLGYTVGSAPTGSQEATDKEVLLTLEVFDNYNTGARSDWIQKFEEAHQFRSGVQWTTEEENELKTRGQSPVVVNRLHPIVETGKALLTYNQPQFRSTGREDSDRRTSKIFADTFAWVWSTQVSNGNEELKLAVDDYYVGGMGALHIFQDPHADMGKGECRIQSVDPRDLFIDPNVTDLYARDSAHLLVVKNLTDEQSQRLWPEFWHIISKAQTIEETHHPTTSMGRTQEQKFSEDITDSYHTKRRFIHRYTKLSLSLFHIYDPTIPSEFMYDVKEYRDYRKESAYIVMTASGEKRIVTDKDMVEQLDTLYEDVGEVFHLVAVDPVWNPMTNQMVESPPVTMPGDETEDPMAIPMSTTFLAKTTHGKLIDDKTILVNKIKQNRVKLVLSCGQHLLYKRILPCEDYPIVPLMNVFNRNAFPESDVRIYRPIQEYINKMRSLIIAHTTNATNVKVLVPRGSVDRKILKQEWSRAGSAFIEYEAELGQPVVAGPIPLPNELYKNEADAKHDLEYGFGIYELMQGSAATAPSTYRGTILIDEYGQRRIKSRRDDIEGAINQLAKVAIPLMQQLYTEEKVIRLVQPNNSTKETKINIPLYDQFTGEEIRKFHDITVGRYDIVIVSGSTLPSNRWAMLDTYLELHKQGIIDQVEVLKKTDVVDAV